MRMFAATDPYRAIYNEFIDLLDLNCFVGKSMNSMILSRSQNFCIIFRDPLRLDLLL